MQEKNMELFAKTSSVYVYIWMLYLTFWLFVLLDTLLNSDTLCNLNGTSSLYKHRINVKKILIIILKNKEKYEKKVICVDHQSNAWRPWETQLNLRVHRLPLYIGSQIVSIYISVQHHLSNNRFKWDKGSTLA